MAPVELPARKTIPVRLPIGHRGGADLGSTGVGVGIDARHARAGTW